MDGGLATIRGGEPGGGHVNTDVAGGVSVRAGSSTGGGGVLDGAGILRWDLVERIVRGGESRMDTGVVLRLGGVADRGGYTAGVMGLSGSAVTGVGEGSRSALWRTVVMGS